MNADANRFLTDLKRGEVVELYLPAGAGFEKKLAYFVGVYEQGPDNFYIRVLHTGSGSAEECVYRLGADIRKVRSFHPARTIEIGAESLSNVVLSVIE